jgi:prophage regulatory protein
VEPSGRLLRPSEVVRLTGLSKSAIYAKISDGEFPPFLKIGVRASAMPQSWLAAFVKARADEAAERNAATTSEEI